MKRFEMFALSLTLLIAPSALLADVCAPAKVTAITVNTGTNDAAICWTATGDDCSTGNATSYEVRYSGAVITDTNWQSASVIGSGSAPSNGSRGSDGVSGLSCNTTYYFAVFLIDDAGNRSPLGTTSATTQGCLTQYMGECN